MYKFLARYIIIGNSIIVILTILQILNIIQ